MYIYIYVYIYIYIYAHTHIVQLCLQKYSPPAFSATCRRS